MTLPSPVTLVPLHAAAGLLPARHGLAAGWMPDNAQAQNWCDRVVLCVHGDLDLPSLDLQALPPALRNAAASEEQPAAEPPLLLWVQGCLRVAGSLVDQGAQPGTGLCVLGDMECAHALLGPASVHIEGNLRVGGLLWSDAGALRTALGGLVLHGALHAQVGVCTPDGQLELHGTRQVPLWFDAQRDLAVQAGWRTEALTMALHPDVLEPLAPGVNGLAGIVRLSALAAALRGNGPVLRSGAPPSCAPAPTLCADDAMSAANLRQLLKAALPDKSRDKAPGWFGQTDFMLSRQHEDEDGDLFQNSLFVTVWKTWDFWISEAPPPAPAELVGQALRKAWARLRRQPARHRHGFTRLYRAYDAYGIPGAWLALGDAAADPAARAACEHAWQGVIDYWRKAEDDRRAGRPQRERLLALLTPERIESLTLLPVFTAQYNDWWDSERNGWWENDLWIGARQPCVHHGRRWGRALKLSWEQGQAAPGDPPDNAHACYQIDIEQPSPMRPATVRITYAQRQGDKRIPLPADAVDHMARLARLFANLEQWLRAPHAPPQARETGPQYIDAGVQLLLQPPFAPHLTDAEIFPADLLALSQAWQADGRRYAVQMRKSLAHAATASSTEHAAAPPHRDMPADARSHRASAVLHIARMVSRHADAGLAARFHRRFAFSAEAFAHRAAQGAPAIAPLFALDDGRIVARVGTAHAHDGYWALWSADGLHHQRLARVQAVGRSPNRQYFAVSDGQCITTRAGWDGPPTATLEHPPADGRPPVTRHCKATRLSGSSRSTMADP